MTDASGSERVTRVAEERRADRRGMVLALATVGFLVNFWAWALIRPLGVAYREQLGLTAFQQALLVAVVLAVWFQAHRNGSAAFSAIDPITRLSRIPYALVSPRRSP